jgi:selenocysteine-specific elongation factor
MSRDGQPWQLAGIASCLQIGASEAESLAAELTEEDKLLSLIDGYFFPTEQMNALCEKLGDWLKDYSARWPLRFGAPKKEAAQVHFPKMDQKQQRALFQYLDGTDMFVQDDKLIWPAGWKPMIGDKQSEIIAAVRGIYAVSPFAPQPWTETVAELDIPAKEQGEYLQWFQRSGEMVRVSDEIVYTSRALEDAERILRENSTDGGFTLAEARDWLGTNRKAAHQICSYFDLIKLTYWDREKHYWR